MIEALEFFEILKNNEIDFFTGVPDSTLKHFCSLLDDNAPANNHIISSNEGAAIALATGYYLATNKIPLVYMQNSGLGNAVNPLTSLVDREVFGIPILLLIGWRGEPGKKDEPQHLKQGKITLNLLETLEIPFAVLDGSIEHIKKTISKAKSFMRSESHPYAIVVSGDTFEKYKSIHDGTGNRYECTREQVIKTIVDYLDHNDFIISTTGKTSRELFEYRALKQQGHQNDFLTIGSMGHCSMIALGIALQKSNKNIYCIDGDGSIIMHMGNLTIIGQHAKNNIRHILINNGVHDSVGGQPTVGFHIDFQMIAKACGYTLTLKAESYEEIKKTIAILKSSKGPAFLEIRVTKGSRANLGRPTLTPRENKESYMEALKKNRA